MLAERSFLRNILARLRTRAVEDEVAAAVDGRVMAGQLQLLNSSAVGAIGNVAGVIIVVLIAHAELSGAAIALWVGVTAAIVVALLRWIAAVRRRGTDELPAMARRLHLHFVFATSIGLCWGVPSLVFGLDLSAGHMMLLTLIMLSATAACCAALGAYLPCFFGYCLGALLPLALVNLLRPGDEAIATAFLVIIYIPILAGVVRSYNQGALGALRLRARNEVLASSLAAAEAATVAANRSKWDTLAHLSHELRTPMNAIIGFSEVMRDQVFGELSSRYHGYSIDINTSGRYALDLIQAILDASQAEAGQVTLVEERIAPAQFIAECMRMVEPAAAEKRIALAYRGDALPEIVGDRAKLRQALLNLLTNAIKYMECDGHVAVEASCAGGGLVVAVADDGIGIAAEDLARCLEPFVRLGNPMTRKVAGVGLGLPIAKRLIEAHGGTLTISSTPGYGTTVTLRLPPERCAAAEPMPAPHGSQGAAFGSPAIA